MAAPVTRAFGSAIDPIPVQAPFECAPVERPGTRALADLLKDHYGIPYGGLTRKCDAAFGDPKSAHKAGRAIDWSLNFFDDGERAIADEVINWLLAPDSHGNEYANARRLGVAHLIWNKRSWRAERGESADQSTWKVCFTGPGTCGNTPHQDHMHITLSADGADKLTSWWTDNTVPVMREYLVGAPLHPYASGLAVYVRGTDGHVWQKAFIDGDWSDWNDLGGEITGTPVAVEYNGDAHVFARGTDGKLWQKKFDDHGDWSDWNDLGGEIIDSPAVVEHNGVLHVFVRGTDTGLWQKKWQNGDWSEWIELGGELGGSPTVLPFKGGIGLYVRGTDGKLWHKSFGNGAWTVWFDLGGSISGASIAAVKYNDDVHVFVRGTDGELYQKKFDDDHWSDWIHHEGAIEDSPEALAFGSALGVYVQGTDGKLWQRSFDNGVWTGWIDLGGEVTGTPVAIDYHDAAHIFIRGVDGGLHQKKFADGAWTWRDHGGGMTSYYDS
jgi:hypothetical protein